MKTFDLIYVQRESGRTMSCGIFDDANPDDAALVGPFPANESGPKIVAALVSAGVFGSQKDAEAAYAFEHFKNMHAGTNKAGQPYPFPA